MTGPLPADAAERKAIPLCSGVLDYFPSALAEVAKCSHRGNEQHNKGEALCARYGGLYVYRLEGGAMLMGIPGKGEVSVDSLLMDDGKPQVENGGKVATIKPAPRRTD